VSIKQAKKRKVPVRDGAPWAVQRIALDGEESEKGLDLQSSANADGARGEPTPVKRAGILLRRG
jgi:hypothetical protein